MTNLDLNLEELLDDRFSVEIKDYWKLPESDKTLITKSIIRVLYPKIMKHRDYVMFYLSLLDERREHAEELEEFERADIIIRLQNKIHDLLPQILT